MGGDVGGSSELSLEMNAQVLTGMSEKADGWLSQNPQGDQSIQACLGYTARWCSRVHEKLSDASHATWELEIEDSILIQDGPECGMLGSRIRTSEGALMLKLSTPRYSKRIGLSGHF
jgi:hypothetical protein